MTIIHVNPGEGQAGQAFMAKDRRKDRFLRMKAVTARTGMSISTIYRREIAGRFPRRMLIGLRSVAWYESDIDDFMADPMGYRWLGEAEVREAASGPGRSGQPRSDGALPLVRGSEIGYKTIRMLKHRPEHAPGSCRSPCDRHPWPFPPLAHS